jgi:hypothetical protein
VSYSDTAFTKDNLDFYLRELAKEFRRLNGKVMPAEIILIGGASVVANYGFRDLTYDIDALITASSVMKDAIKNTGEKLNLPTGWLNTDFVKTRSYSSELYRFSINYKTFSNILIVRTIASEYLIAMKLMSGRQYKYDLSDVVGILLEHQKRNAPITLAQIDKAFTDLYGSWTDAPKVSAEFLNDIFIDANYEQLYQKYRNEEKLARKALIYFQEQYHDIKTEGNIQDILAKLKKISNQEK